MRIERLSLLAYGPFRGLEIDLSAPGLHLVFGRNEAGKSTTLRAIRGLLYGIDRKSRDDHAQKELRVGGTLVSSAGERIRVVRRKANANTLLDEHGKTLDEDVVLRFLRGVTRETFEHAFALDHDTLRRGAEGLLEGKGDLGESLFDASVGGGGSVQALLAELNAEADKIYKPRGSALPLNEALKALADAQRLVRDRQASPAAYIAQETALEQARAAHAERAKYKAELAKKRTTMTRAFKRSPLEKRAASLREERRELGVLADKLAVLASIDERRAAYEKADATRRDASVEAQRCDVRVAEASRRAGVTTLDDAPRVDARKKARAAQLVADRSKCEAQARAALEEIARGERELARLLPLAVDTSALARALDAARALGDAEARAARDAKAIARRRRELEVRADQLGIFEGDLLARVALRLPAIEAVEHLAARASEIEKSLARTDDRIAHNAEERASVERQIAEQTGDFAPPSKAELVAARAARDTALRDGSPDAARLLRDADEIADRMINDADRVTQLSRLRQSHVVLEQQRTSLADERAKLSSARAALDAEHAKLFAPLVPRSFAEMRKWLERHAQLVEEHAGVLAAEEDLASRNEEIVTARAALADALGAPSTLGAMVEDAARRVTEAEQARRAVAKLRADMDERRVTLHAQESTLAEVRAKLFEITRPLGLPDDASGEEITSALSAFDDLFAALDAKQANETRARAADKEARAFETELAALVSELAPDLANAPPRDAARTLVERARRAERNAAELAKTLAEIEELAVDALPADLDVSDAAMEALEAEYEEVDRDVQRRLGEIIGLEGGLEKLRADSHAADAATEAHEAVARIRTLTERYARARLGAVILSREIARYRDENQGPLLAAASSLFARLTLQKFTGIKAGGGSADDPALVCVRSSGEEVSVEGLSEGTRDQLYMSLRLASLLRYAGAREPLPLVLDDVLVHSDDERASAALVVLGEVARSMQVLLFTHHARIVDLARAAVGRDLVVHELAPVQVPLFEATA